MRYYLDEDISPVVARIARQRFKLDVTSAHELNNRGWSDEAQLAFASEHNRCIVTNNRADFHRLAEQYRNRGMDYAGIAVLSDSLPPDDFTAIAAAIAAHHAMYPDMVPNAFFLRRVGTT